MANWLAGTEQHRRFDLGGVSAWVINAMLIYLTMDVYKGLKAERQSVGGPVRSGPGLHDRNATTIFTIIINIKHIDTVIINMI